MVIVDPHQTPGFAIPGGGLGELAVDLQISLPIPGIEVAQGVQIVKHRPDDLVGEAIVKLLFLPCRKLHGMQVVAGIPTGPGQNLFHLVLVARAGNTRPADPVSSPVLQDREKSGHEPTGTRLCLPVSFLRF